MYAVVYLADDREVFVNLDCSIWQLIRYLEKVSNYNKEGKLDLSDLTGRVKNLNDHVVGGRGDQLIKTRERLVLVAVRQNENDEGHNDEGVGSIYEPLLNVEQSKIVGKSFLIVSNAFEVMYTTNLKCRLLAAWEAIIVIIVVLVIVPINDVIVIFSRKEEEDDEDDDDEKREEFASEIENSYQGCHLSYEKFIINFKNMMNNKQDCQSDLFDFALNFIC
ncbi:hypothetical protein HELRODRAFT_169719 [Helobdella robusta]|uniref:Uncharacterized protein n=1 Tax=Helobdella robusta TaxID=6412 RepID=T1F299_HELRO|nr:hypothetical protein HELRODRAFT_169719 [Helobdella robusta]ESO08001.1 hypothetical protein HELRODRAFT_169719 [Helobdella robusta]